MHGNVARFINHRCEPNLYVQPLCAGHADDQRCGVALFAAARVFERADKALGQPGCPPANQIGGQLAGGGAGLKAISALTSQPEEIGLPRIAPDHQHPVG